MSGIWRGGGRGTRNWEAQEERSQRALSAQAGPELGVAGVSWVFLFFCNLGQLENLMLEGYVGLLLPLAAGAWLLQNRSCECFWDQIGEGR